jgi:hypothetical protein
MDTETESAAVEAEERDAMQQDDELAVATVDEIVKEDNLP